MSKQNTVLLIGGSDAGKSNFLFRFWLAIREKLNPALLPDGPPPVAEYLNQGAGKLLIGEFEIHTPHGTNEICEIPVLAAGEKAIVVVPDRPGEEWSRIYRERRIPGEWMERLGCETACLILVRAHSDINQAPLDWISVQHFHGNQGNLMGPARQEVATPTQVVLVDWIQIISRTLRSGPNGATRPKIGLVISAWDLLSDDEQLAGPTQYLKDQYPLLADFLESNSKSLEIEIFGMSLFGGDPQHSQSFKEACLNADNPCRGGYVVRQIAGEVRKVPDLTLPIAWALGLANAQ
jgi:hypothetical protein